MLEASAGFVRIQRKNLSMQLEKPHDLKQKSNSLCCSCHHHVLASRLARLTSILKFGVAQVGREY